MKATVAYRIPPCWSCQARFETWAERDRHVRESSPCQLPSMPPREPLQRRRPGAPLSHGDQRL